MYRRGTEKAGRIRGPKVAMVAGRDQLRLSHHVKKPTISSSEGRPL